MSRSYELQRILKRQINDTVRNDCRSDGNDILLGADKNTIFNLLEKGRADFRSASDGFSASEKVLFYSYFNMKSHIDTCKSIFEKHKEIFNLISKLHFS